MRNSNFLIIAALLSLISCMPVEERMPHNEYYFYYINNSSHQIVISSRVNETLADYKLDSVLNRNDTIQLFDPSAIGRLPFGTNASVTIIFDSVKCFTFGDSMLIDPSTDIRDYGAYHSTTVQAERGTISTCYYTITDSLYEKASACP